MNEIAMTVRPFDTGADKEAALKPLEEAAEVFGAWQEYFREEMYSLQQDYPSQDIRFNVEEGLSDYIDALCETLADKIADCIQASVNLAASYSIDLPEAMKRCEKRNRDRGRYE